jgi:hypothetical protein
MAGDLWNSIMLAVFVCGLLVVSFGSRSSRSNGTRGSKEHV